jgi:HEAT repeat protein
VILSRRYEDLWRRLTISKEELDRIYLALAIVKREIETEAHVQVAIEVDEDGPTLDAAVGPSLAKLSMLTRVNRGSFDADDKRFRGPYHSVISLGPAAWSPYQGGSAGMLDQFYVMGPDANLTGTERVFPVHSGMEFSASIYGSPGIPIWGTSVSHLASWLGLVEGRAASHWLAGRVPTGSHFQNPASAFSDLGQLNPEQQYRVLGSVPSPGEPGRGTVAIADQAHLGFVTGGSGAMESPAGFVRPIPVSPSPGIGARFEVSEDPSKGSTLLVTFDDAGAQAALLQKEPVLRGPVSFEVRREGTAAGVLEIARGPGSSFGGVYALPTDGEWHAVTLRDFGGSVLRLYRGERTDGKLAYRFAKFVVGDAGGAVEALPSSPMGGTGVDLSSASGVATVKAQLLDKVLKLGALHLLGLYRVEGLEKEIGAAMDDLDGRIAELGAKALAFQGTEAAWAELRRGLEHGVSEREKAECALAVAAHKDPAMLGPMSALMVARSWETRVSAAQAIARNGGPLAQTLLAAFMDQNEPEVRYTAADNLDPMNDTSARKLLFASVNDPSDAVRLRASQALLHNPVYLKDGLRAVLDDSRWVRIQMLRSLGAAPIAGAKASILQALALNDVEVRAAALNALAEVPEPVTPAELGDAVMKDANPAVVQALKALGKQKGFKTG